MTFTIQRNTPEIRLLTKSERLHKLKLLFARHIGIDNSLTRKQIFEHVYGKINNYQPLQIYFLWSRLQLDMNQLRKTTNYFIVSYYHKNRHFYYIVKTMDDAKPYLILMETIHKRSEQMRQRCIKAVKESFYKRLDEGQE